MKFYFTFGFNQPMKEILDYVIIEAKDYSEARDIMMKNFNRRWAFQYTEEAWLLKNGNTQADEYNYRPPLTILTDNQ